MMVPGSVPKNGDVVVALVPSATGSFTVRQFPGEVQCSAATFDEAVQLARSFARKHGLDLWYCEADAFRLLERYRWQDLQAQDGVPSLNIL